MLLNNVLWLVTAAFILGACPFSLWMARLGLRKDIRQFGEGNPGTTNVLRAGGRWTAFASLALDMTKGVPFTALAWTIVDVTQATALLVGVSAILGSAFSPFLRFKGGKSIAITAGVMLTFPDKTIPLLAMALMGVGLLFIRQAGWMVMLSVTGTLAYVVITGRGTWYIAFMVFVTVLLAFKHGKDLAQTPVIVNRPLKWLARANPGAPF